MTDEIKPVPCGCGGEAKVDWVLQPDGVYMTGVYCENCGTKTIPFWSMKKDEAIDYAITAWNTAMGERTAKVIFLEMKGNPKNIVWKCAECGQYMHRASWAREVNYCSHCGAKLDWSGNE